MVLSLVFLKKGALGRVQACAGVRRRGVFDVVFGDIRRQIVLIFLFFFFVCGYAYSRGDA